VGLNQDWKSTEQIPRDLLHWLDEGTNSGGQRYLEVRRRLELYFDRKNCVAPAELADETLNRVAKKLEESGEINDVAPLQYCFIVAKYVFLETLRAEKRSPFYPPLSGSNPNNPNGQSTALLEADTAPEKKAKISECLDRCLKDLSPADRELFVEYYQGNQKSKIERRAALATRLGLTASALSVRACRIRERLETCIDANLNKRDL
jgi:DNA-directed RNA polymerase specialized sigma24 family protein